MNKRILYTISTLIIVIALVTIYDVKHISKEEYKELVENHPMQERLKLSKKERKKMGIPPNRYFDDQYLLEMDPATGKTRPENLLNIRKNKSFSSKITGVPGQTKEMAWVERGPNNIGGRTRVVFYDPNDTSGKRVFAGGVSGGLWVNNDITNINSMWSQVGIDENLSISCYAIDPNDSNIWYVGTGEVYTQDDGVGNGIWRTTNGGATWENMLTINLDLTKENRPYFINQIVAWNINGATRLFFSMDGQFDIDPIGFQASGWWSLQDGEFKRIDFLTSRETPYVFSDVEIAKDNSLWLATKPNLFGHGGGKIFRSTDGVNFTEKYSFVNGERVELSVSKQNANTVYALASTNNSEGVELVKTINGNDFLVLSKPNDVGTDVPANDFARSQGFYNLTIQIDPENDEIVYVGGINLFKSTNSGVNWSQISKWTNNHGLNTLVASLVHADHHAIAFDSQDNNKAVFANDGGVYYCADLNGVEANSNAIQARNFGYNITQFYSGAIGQDVNNEMILGGAQDNGSLLGVSNNSNGQFEAFTKTGINSFVDVFGGDGVESFIDKEGEYMIVSFIHNVYGLYRLPLNQDDNQLIDVSEDQESGSFVNIAELDHNLDVLYTNGSFRGTPRVSRFTSITTNPLRRNFTNALLSEVPTAIKVSPFTTNSSTVFIGTEGSSILKVTNMDTDNPSWTNVDVNGQIDIGAISCIDFGTNENEILVTLHNYGVNNIYYTQDGGVNWKEKEGNFPDIPVKAIKMNPLNENEVIIGTNAGVWSTNNFLSATPNWQQAQNGMSSVKVTKFDIRTSDNTILAATYGRGLFTGTFTKTSFSNGAELEKNIKIKSTVISDGKINLTLDTEISGIVEVLFYAVNGSLVHTEKLKISEELEINIPFQSGVYLMNISAGGVHFTEKIIVAN